jgi:hypothetical protein
MNRLPEKHGEPTAWASRLGFDSNTKGAEKMADRETIIETGGGGGSAGIIAGIIIVALVVVGFFLFVNNNGGSSGTVDVDVPAVNVDVQPDGQ